MQSIIITITLISILLNLYLQYSNNLLNNDIINFKIKVQSLNSYIETLSKELEKKNKENDLLQ